MEIGDKSYEAYTAIHFLAVLCELLKSRKGFLVQALTAQEVLLCATMPHGAVAELGINNREITRPGLLLQRYPASTRSAQHCAFLQGSN